MADKMRVREDGLLMGSPQSTRLGWMAMYSGFLVLGLFVTARRARSGWRMTLILRRYASGTILFMSTLGSPIPPYLALVWKSTTARHPGRRPRHSRSVLVH